jgi:ankyrin repeat protein
MNRFIVLLCSAVLIISQDISGMEGNSQKESVDEVVPVLEKIGICDCSTNLLTVVEKSCLSCCERLFTAGTDLNRKREGGLTPLHVAVLDYDPQSTPQVVKALLEKGADPMIQDDDLYTPLLSAVLYVRPEIINLLLGEGLTQEELIKRYCKNDDRVVTFLLCMKRWALQHGIFPRPLKLIIVVLVCESKRIKANGEMVKVQNNDKERSINLAKNYPEIKEQLKKYETND